MYIPKQYAFPLFIYMTHKLPFVLSLFFLSDIFRSNSLRILQISSSTLTSEEAPPSFSVTVLIWFPVETYKNVLSFSAAAYLLLRFVYNPYIIQKLKLSLFSPHPKMLCIWNVIVHV
jgi:hypothetical protein